MAPRKGGNLAELVRSGSVSDGEVLRYKSKSNELLLVARARETGVEVHGCPEPLTLTLMEDKAGSKLRRPADNTYTLKGDSLSELLAKVGNPSTAGHGGTSKSSRHGPPPNFTPLEDENDEFCHICCLGGDLVCCETCPATFHAACIGLSTNDLSDDDWFCPLCSCAVCGQAGFVPLKSSSLSTSCATIKVSCSGNLNSVSLDTQPKLHLTPPVIKKPPTGAERRALVAAAGGRGGFGLLRDNTSTTSAAAAGDGGDSFSLLKSAPSEEESGQMAVEAPPLAAYINPPPPGNDTTTAGAPLETQTTPKEGGRIAQAKSPMKFLSLNDVETGAIFAPGTTVATPSVLTAPFQTTITTTAAAGIEQISASGNGIISDNNTLSSPHPSQSNINNNSNSSYQVDFTPLVNLLSLEELTLTEHEAVPSIPPGIPNGQEDFDDRDEVACAVTGRRRHLRCCHHNSDNTRKLSKKKKKQQQQQQEEEEVGLVSSSRQPWFESPAARAQSKRLAAVCAAGVIPLANTQHGTIKTNMNSQSGEGEGFVSGTAALQIQIIRGAAVAGTSCSGYIPAYSPDQQRSLRQLLTSALRIVESSYAPLRDSRTGHNMLPWLVRGARFDAACADFSNVHTAVLLAGKTVVAVACFRAFGSQLAEVPILACRPEVKKQGLGSVLMAAVERVLCIGCRVETVLVPSFVSPGVPLVLPNMPPGYQPLDIAQSKWGYQVASSEQLFTACHYRILRIPGVVLASKVLNEGSLLLSQECPVQLKLMLNANVNKQTLLRERFIELKTGRLFNAPSPPPPPPGAAAALKPLDPIQATDTTTLNGSAYVDKDIRVNKDPSLSPTSAAAAAAARLINEATAQIAPQQQQQQQQQPVSVEKKKKGRWGRGDTSNASSGRKCIAGLDDGAHSDEEFQPGSRRARGKKKSVTSYSKRDRNTVIQQQQQQQLGVTIGATGTDEHVLNGLANGVIQGSNKKRSAKAPQRDNKLGPAAGEEEGGPRNKKTRGLPPLQRLQAVTNGTAPTAPTAISNGDGVISAGAVHEYMALQALKVREQAMLLGQQATSHALEQAQREQTLFLALQQQQTQQQLRMQNAHNLMLLQAQQLTYQQQNQQQQQQHQQQNQQIHRGMMIVQQVPQVIIQQALPAGVTAVPAGMGAALNYGVLSGLPILNANDALALGALPVNPNNNNNNNPSLRVNSGQVPMPAPAVGPSARSNKERPVSARTRNRVLNAASLSEDGDLNVASDDSGDQDQDVEMLDVRYYPQQAEHEATAAGNAGGGTDAQSS